MKIKITPQYSKYEWDYDDNSSIFSRKDKEGREVYYREWWVNELEEHKADGVLYLFGRNIYSKRICSCTIEKGRETPKKFEFETEEDFQKFLKEHKVKYK